MKTYKIVASHPMAELLPKNQQFFQIIVSFSGKYVIIGSCEQQILKRQIY